MSYVSPAPPVPVALQVAAIGFGEVGATVLAVRYGAAFSEGDILAGSGLNPAGISGGFDPADGANSGSVTRGIATLSGSWRAMCRNRYIDYGRYGVFVRVA